MRTIGSWTTGGRAWAQDIVAIDTDAKNHQNKSTMSNKKIPNLLPIATGQHFNDRIFMGGTSDSRMRAAVAFQEQARRDHFGIYPIRVSNDGKEAIIDMSEWSEKKMFSAATRRVLKRVTHIILD